ncbi:hypothetical protein GPECTOR_3g343 [Gonium pectorale]|uniref:Uncharacterized protein n=1 Tax=Gonium pectorale TaxID=33097 RepID=A0A150GZB5_GONPE|nr:hypothetical protein GPECTOR_3g343 [Gonium pectorale]|eukprot:KXZ55199.1 hypothetical protein GPECTOR_3g343 [Gonium pectorale]
MAKREPISGAQFEDFPQTHRRNVAPPVQNQLGPGLQPLDEARQLPVALARSRVAHDGAEMHEDPTCFVSTAGREAAAAGSLLPPLMSSYQAMQAGLPLEQKKRTGRKMMAPPSEAARQGPGSFFGGAGGGGLGGVRNDSPAVLNLGTTRASPHVPGYCGHIPKTMTAADPIPTRTIDKSLILENYKPYGSGYTGRKL